MKKRAIISVSDKRGAVELGRDLIALGWEIISTGGTYRTLKEAGLSVANISDVTGFPEVMDGRVKTLHPAIHSGILARRHDENDMAQLDELKLTPIDAVIVNLYPFREAVSRPDTTWEEAMEHIDIGGPSMLRAAAKNHRDVTVIVDPEDYREFIRQLREFGETTREWRQQLGAKVFRHTAAYDSWIADYLTREAEPQAYPERLTVTYERVQILRYGENPHQSAAFYRDPNARVGLPVAEQLNGKALSYNNINDADAAWDIVQEFSVPTAVAVKHTNPCGVGIGKDVDEAFLKAYAADPVSIFGGIVAFNRIVDASVAERMHRMFLEIVLAPDFTPEALDILTQKKNLRLLRMKDGDGKARPRVWRSVRGGLLVQEADRHLLSREMCRVVTERKPTDKEWEQLLFAWRVVKHVKSNAIVLAKDHQTVGIGAGQMNRVGAAQIAIDQAGDKAQGAVMASDAFFPMPDTVEAAAAAGIRAVIQPGGSKRDQDSIDQCNAKGMSMVFTGVRHFKH